MQPPVLFIVHSGKGPDYYTNLKTGQCGIFDIPRPHLRKNNYNSSGADTGAGRRGPWPRPLAKAAPSNTRFLPYIFCWFRPFKILYPPLILIYISRLATAVEPTYKICLECSLYLLLGYIDQNFRI